MWPGLRAQVIFLSDGARVCELGLSVFLSEGARHDFVEMEDGDGVGVLEGVEGVVFEREER